MAPTFWNKYPGIAIACFTFLSFSSCKTHLESNVHPIYQVFSQHETKHLAQNQMKLVAAGIPRKEKIEKIALHYAAFKKIKIPEARKLVVECVEDFLAMVNDNEKIREHLGKHPVTYKEIQLDIGFGKTEGGFQEPPNIAYIYLDRGFIHYCYLDGVFGHFTEEKDVKESYETARQLLD